MNFLVALFTVHEQLWIRAMPHKLSARERATLLEHDPAGLRQVRAAELIRLHRLAAAGLVVFLPRNARRPRRSRLTPRGRECAQILRDRKICKTLGSVDMQNLYRVTNLGESEIEIVTETGETLSLAPRDEIVCAPRRIRTPRIGGGAWELAPADPAEASV